MSARPPGNRCLHRRRHLFIRLSEGITHRRARIDKLLGVANKLEKDRVGHANSLEDNDDDESRSDGASVLNYAIHDKGEEPGAGTTHSDKGGSTLGASTLTTETNGKNKRVYRALEEVKENDGYNKKVRVGWTDNHRKKGKDETASDAGGEDGTGSWEAGTIYGEICKASCHEAGHGKGGMRDEEIIGY